MNAQSGSVMQRSVGGLQDLREVEPHILQYRVEVLMRAYCECIDADRLEEWPDFFTEDARYEIRSRENLNRGLPATSQSCDGVRMMRDRVVSLRNANIYGRQYYRHLVSNITIGPVNADSVQVRSNYLVVRTMAREGDPMIFSAGGTQDVLAVRDGALRFARRTVVPDNDRIHTLLVIPI